MIENTFIEDEIAERQANGESYDDLEERRNDVQDEIENIRDEGWGFRQNPHITFKLASAQVFINGNKKA